MNRIPVGCIPGLPESLHPFVADAALYDSSCYTNAKVWFSEAEGGIYIKTAPAGTLKTEAEMNAFFHCKKMGAEVLSYLSRDADWMVTQAVPGEDCIHPMYLEDPKRLSELLSQILRHLHSQEPAAFLPNRLESYLTEARRNYREGKFDASLFPDNWGYATPEEAWAVLESTLSGWRFSSPSWSAVFS